MKISFEQLLLQNDAFSATLITTAVKAYYDQTGQRHGMPLLLSLLVLPLVYHRETASVLAAKRRPAILPKAISENRDLSLGVQERMEQMTEMSMDALRLGVAAGVISIDDDGRSLELIPTKTQPTTTFSGDDAQLLQRAARAVGYSFAEVTLPQLGEFLLVRF